MHNRRTLILAAFLALIAAPAAWGAPLPSPGDHWIRVEAPGLAIFSNAPENDTRALAANLETFRSVLSRVGGTLDTRSPVPTFLYVFKDDQSYRFFKPRRKTPGGEVPQDVSGFFIKHRDGNYVAVDATPREDPWAVIYHEYFHFYLLNNFTDIPLWLGEGLAECYSTFRFRDGVAYLGAPVYRHLHWFDEYPLVPLPEILATGADSRDYHEGARQGTFYAESWALTHYLLWGPGGTGGGGMEFLGRVPRGGSLREAVKPLLAGDPEAMRNRLKAYIKTWRIPESTLKPGDMAAGEAVHVADMNRGEILFRLGDYLLHLDPGRAVDAEEYFREAIRVRPGYGPSYSGLAQVLGQAGRHDEANPLFEKALTLDPENHAIVLSYAYSLVEQTFPPGISRRPAGDMPPAMKRARELFQKSSRLAPDIAEVWAGLGMTYVLETGDPAPGIEALERARQLLPGSVEIAFNLASLYRRGGQETRDRELLDRVVSRSEDPKLRAAGVELLARTEVEKAVALLNKGRFKEGLEQLRLLRDRAPTPELRGEIESLLARAEQTAALSRMVGIYNEATAQAARGDFSGAATLFQQVVEQSSDADLTRKAREALEKVRAAEVSRRHVAWYNQAVERYRQRDYEGAAALLRKILKESRDEKIVQAAKDLLSTIGDAAH